jgi:hypothetical protein
VRAALRLRASAGACLVTLALACAHAPPTPARAARAGPPPGPDARELASCGGSGPDSLVLTLSRIPDEDELRRAICDWFSDEPWRVRLRSVGSELPRAEKVRAGELLVTILLASKSSAQLNVTAPGRSAGSPPARWLELVPLHGGFDDVAIEVLAQTLHSTAQASLARAFPPTAPAAPPLPVAAPALAVDAITRASPIVSARGAPASTPPAVASAATAPILALAPAPAESESPADEARARPDFALYPERARRVHSALGYQFYARGGEPLTHGPTLRMELDLLTRGVVLGSFVRAALFTSTPARSGGVEIGLEGMGVGAGLAASLPAQHWLGRLALGTNLDLIDLGVSVNDPEAWRSLPGRTRPRLFLTAETGVAARFSRFEIGADALLRWQTSSSHYDVLEGGQPHTLARAWRLQPGAALEVAYLW